MASPAQAQSSASDGLNVFLNITACNNNGVCEQPTESWPYCPLDCGDPNATSTPTTTPSTPDANTAPYSGGGFIGPFPQAQNPEGSLFINYGVIPGATSATIVWTTRVATLGAVRYGLTTELSGGVVAESAYDTRHGISFGGLQPDTLYYARIFVRTISGSFELSPFIVFRTARDGDIFLKENPLSKFPELGDTRVLTDLGVVLRRDASDQSGKSDELANENSLFDRVQALSSEVRFFSVRRLLQQSKSERERNDAKSFFLNTFGDKVLITWMPPQFDYQFVRITKLENRYPKHALEGTLVYEGRGQQFVDTHSPRLHGYYGIFVKKNDATYSSGVLARVAPVPITVPSSVLHRYTWKNDGSYMKCDAVDLNLLSHYTLFQNNVSTMQTKVDLYCSARIAPWYWLEDFRPVTIYYWIRCVLYPLLGITWPTNVSK
jgi:hypothetical protein